MIENIVDHYYERLWTDKSPGYLIGQFFCEIFELQFNKNYISQFGRLSKLYGREIVFKAILEIAYRTDLDDPSNAMGLLNHICKRLSRELPAKLGSLQPVIEQRIEKVQQVKSTEFIFRSPFDG